MAAPRSHTKSQASALRLEIYKRFCAGESQQAIADALKMRQSNVAYHVNKARAAHSLEIAARRADRLAELERIRSEAWRAWEETQRTPQGAVFLAQLLKAIRQECILLGLDAPARTATTISVEALPRDTVDTIIDRPQAV